MLTKANGRKTGRNLVTLKMFCFTIWTEMDTTIPRWFVLVKGFIAWMVVTWKVTESNLYFFFQIHFEICMTYSAQLFVWCFLIVKFRTDILLYIHKDTLFYLLLVSDYKCQQLIQQLCKLHENTFRFSLCILFSQLFINE